MSKYRLYSQKTIEKTYEIEADSPSEAKGKWLADRSMEPTDSVTLPDEDFVSVAKVEDDGSDSEQEYLEA